MTNWHHISDRDFRNEGWSYVGSGISRLYQAWNNDDDSKYCYNPPSKGRATVLFPIDPLDLPAGAVITSVSVFLRAAKTTNISQSISVNVLANDDTSKFTTRTLYLTTTVQTYEVGTYTRDPRGKAWDIHRLNKLMAQVYVTGTATVAADAVRVFKLYFVVNYRTRPTVAVSGPTGTVKSPTPEISWTYSQSDGDLQKQADYKIFTKLVAEGKNFDPENSEAVFSSTLTGDKTSFILPYALDPDSYYVYVRVHSQYGAKSLWSGRSFALEGPAPGIPTVVVLGDNATASVSLTIQDTSNLLSISIADVEEALDVAANPLVRAVSAATAEPVATNDQYYNLGTSSWKFTATGTGNPTGYTYAYEVAPNMPMSARAQFRTAVTARSCRVDVAWYDELYALISTSSSSTVTDATTGWIEANLQVTSPSTARYAIVQPVMIGPANTEVHYVDGIGLMYGANSVWSSGGHLSRNILSSEYSEDPYTAGWTAASGTTLSRLTNLTPATGISAAGPYAMRLTSATVSPTIALRATGTAYSDTSSGTAYTLNKPAGVVSGDLMVAFVATCADVNFGQVCTPPAGWTLVNSARVQDTVGDVTMFVLKRTAGGSEPSTWTDGAFTVAATKRRAVVIAYSGAADAAEQFVTENVSTRSSDTPTWLTTATVFNTDPSAWRLSAFATRDNVNTGTMVANTTPPFTGISFLGIATSWASVNNSTTYTINRPVGGVTTGDLMIATLAHHGSSVTVTPPTGWTLVDYTNADDDTDDTGMAVMKRTAGSSEPTSWSGTISSARPSKITQACAYRAAANATLQFVAEDSSSSITNTNKIATASVTNSGTAASESWRICAFAGTELNFDTTGSGWSSTEVKERCDNWVTDRDFTNPIALAMYDSAGKVSTGSHQRTGTYGDTFDSAVAWIGIIKVEGTPPTPPSNETERADGVTGSGDPSLHMAIYDSNGVSAVGAWNVTGTYTPTTNVSSQASWIGFIKPADTVIGGAVKATMTNTTDISLVDPKVLKWANNKMTYRASFASSVPGSAYLTMYFYKGNQLISSETKLGGSFSSAYEPLWATYDIPAGTTRVAGGVLVSDRAVTETVDVDQFSIAFGESTVYRPGTNRSTHPIWSIPVIQYNDDDGSGYAGWEYLGGTSLHQPIYDPIDGSCTFTDHTPIPLTARKYRVATLSYGLQGDQFISAYGVESDPVTVTSSDYWLKDLVTPGNSMALNVRTVGTPVSTANMASVFQPLGSDFPVVLTEGYKADQIDLTLRCNRAEFVALRKLLRTGTALFLQTDIDQGWWVRPIGDLGQNTIVSQHRSTDPIREVQVKFVQVKQEE